MSQYGLSIKNPSSEPKEFTLFDLVNTSVNDTKKKSDSYTGDTLAVIESADSEIILSRFWSSSETASISNDIRRAMDFSLAEETFIEYVDLKNEAPEATSTIAIEIRTDNAGEPGSLIHSKSYGNANIGNLYLFEETLPAGNYWLVVYNDSGDDFVIGMTSSGGLRSNDGGLTWNTGFNYGVVFQFLSIPEIAQIGQWWEASESGTLSEIKFLLANRVENNYSGFILELYKVNSLPGETFSGDLRLRKENISGAAATHISVLFEQEITAGEVYAFLVKRADGSTVFLLGDNDYANGGLILNSNHKDNAGDNLAFETYLGFDLIDDQPAEIETPQLKYDQLLTSAIGEPLMISAIKIKTDNAKQIDENLRVVYYNGFGDKKEISLSVLEQNTKVSEPTFFELNLVKPIPIGIKKFYSKFEYKILPKTEIFMMLDFNTI